MNERTAEQRVLGYQVMLANRRLIANNYLPVTETSGINECKHFRAEGIPCPFCDEALVASSKLPASPVPEGLRAVVSARDYLNEQTPKNWDAVEVLNRSWGKFFKERVVTTEGPQAGVELPERPQWTDWTEADVLDLVQWAQDACTAMERVSPDAPRFIDLFERAERLGL